MALAVHTDQIDFRSRQSMVTQQIFDQHNIFLLEIYLQREEMTAGMGIESRKSGLFCNVLVSTAEE